MGGYYTAVSTLVERLATRLAREPAAAGTAPGPRAAVAAILDADDRVLLMRRTERAGDPWSGHVSLPGGRHGHGDKDLLSTAIRETREELDVDLAAARVLGQMPVLHPLSSGKHGIEVTPFAFAAPGPLAPKLGAEAAAVFWLPLPLAASGALDGTYEYAPAGMTFPSWSYEGHTIWGLTPRILNAVLELSRA